MNNKDWNGRQLAGSSSTVDNRCTNLFVRLVTRGRVVGLERGGEVDEGLDVLWVLLSGLLEVRLKHKQTGACRRMTLEHNCKKKRVLVGVGAPTYHK